MRRKRGTGRARNVRDNRQPEPAKEAKTVKLVWKLSIPQICVIVCLGVISFVVIRSSFVSMRGQYVRDAVDVRFQRLTKEIETRELEAVGQTALFVRLPAVMRAYEMALEGNIDDPFSPQVQAARVMLRAALAPMLDSYSAHLGHRLRLHFHLPNSRSLLRLWRDRQTIIKGEWIDVSDDLSYRPTVVEVNKTGSVVKGIELGGSGFVARGVIPVKTPDGRQIGSAEVLQDFQPILDAMREEGKVEFFLYINQDRLTMASDPRSASAIATDFVDPQKNPRKGDFVRVTAPKNDALDALITPELLFRGKGGSIVEQRGAMAFATLPISDYRGTQAGVLVCAMNTETVSKIVDTAELVLTLMLVGMAIMPSLMLLQGVHLLITGPLSMVREKIQDITEDRADLNAPIPSRQQDEIGDLAKWFNALMTKLIDQLRTIEHLSLVDQLTGIPNRRSFDERLRTEWARAIRGSYPVSLLLVDADRFKQYNDTYGHLQGDVALQTIAKVFARRVARPADFYARWGGEEFAVLLPNTDKNGSLYIAEAIRMSVEDAVIHGAGGVATKITVSIGIHTCTPVQGQSSAAISAFISGADNALYTAKRTGRNKVCLYDGRPTP
jgi:diguanylate cyclase (GGDEF)-like protein